MATDAPCAICSRCGKYASNAGLIGLRCSERDGAKRCTGVFGSAIGKGDWRQCLQCLDRGCDVCQRTGWVFQRKG